jgi:hypothetical protein
VPSMAKTFTAGFGAKANLEDIEEPEDKAISE